MLGMVFKTTSFPANNPPTVVTDGSLISGQMFTISSKQFTPLSVFHRHSHPSILRRSIYHHSVPISAVRHRLLRSSRLNSHFPIKSSHHFHSQSTSNSLINHVSLSQLSHPWPEYSELLKSISVVGCFDLKDEFVQNESLSMEFVDAACSCLEFAKDRPDILGLLSKDDMQVLINNGAPFLFKNAIEIQERMRLFLQGEVSSEATTVDLMKYILNYASNPIIYPERNINETTESSARNLLKEMANLSVPAIENFNGIVEDEQTPVNLGPNVTMKRGEWVCQKCNFFNHRRNSVCIKCECERTPNESYDNVNQFHSNSLTVPETTKSTSTGKDVKKYSGYAPFVPLPADMFAKKTKNTTSGNNKEPVMRDHGPKATVSANSSEKQVTKTETRIKDTAEEEKSERWFKKVAELHDVTDLTTAISDDDFPEIMPMRKGENRFVVSKKKDRSLTSPTYKRQQAMEQESNSGFVPFVPFPPDYFAKKDDNQQSKTTNSSQVSHEISSKATNDLNLMQEINSPSSHISHENSSKATNDMNLVQETRNTQINKSATTPETSNGDLVTLENQKLRNGWEGSSLEGSAVKETDPLDMSEEAKAERWFKRVAQIKDISELTQIPDEDFPSIMPMRKGVNRYVVSKRKTPLERRLTSPQYRKDTRTVSSEPMKKEDDGS